jgi:4-hydroxy-tetrahydrodipicolinate synthase
MYTEELKKIFQGVGALVLTPFDDELKVNYNGIRHNVKFMKEHGIVKENGFFAANGTMGECGALTLEERKEVIKTVVLAAGDVPVLAGVNDTSCLNAVDLINYAKKAGAKGALLTPPFYIPYSDDQIYGFYEYVNDHVDFPIMIYNNPAVAGRDLPVSLLHRLAGLKNIFGLKQATTSIQSFVHTDLLREELLIFTASSSQQPFGDILGASGFISFISNINAPLQVKLWNAVKNKDMKTALECHKQEMMIYDWWWNGGVEQPAGGIVHMKAGMDMIGMVGGKVRPPMLNRMSEKEIEGLKKIMKQWGVLSSAR